MEQLSSPSGKRMTLEWTQTGRTMTNDTTHTNRLIQMVLERVRRVIRRNGCTTARYL
ncbi:hypothetical protein J4Q44_G00016750 [Coregonus suidteri]|uniref:Uncharacterized protein n=1 Tax=Coregonus suidteri TaxID=861788 RepID=A0AAN8R5J0_9TELE